MKAAVTMIEKRRSVRSPKRKRKQKVNTRRRGKVVDMGRREGWGEQKQTAGNDTHINFGARVSRSLCTIGKAMSHGTQITHCFMRLANFSKLVCCMVIFQFHFTCGIGDFRSNDSRILIHFLQVNSKLLSLISNY